MKLQNRRSRRRIAAFNFLSNISLDGTYNDTKYSVFNRKHHRLKDDISEENEIHLNVCSSEKSDDENQESVIDGTTCLPADNAGSNLIFQTHKSVHKSLSSDTTSVSPAKHGSIKVSSSEEKDNIRARSLSQRQESITGHIQQGDISTIDKYGEKCNVGAISLSDHSFKDVQVFAPSNRSQLRNQRLLFVSKKKAPVVVCSTLVYNRKSQHGRIEEEFFGRTRNLSGTKPFLSQEALLYLGLNAISRVEDGQDISYSDLLVPSRGRLIKRAVSERGSLDSTEPIQFQFNAGRELFRSRSHDPNLYLHRSSNAPSLEKVTEEFTDSYDPNVLDDPELQSGSYRTLMTFSSYMTSVIDYVKPSVLKKELNEKFKEKFPHVQLTLTKLRSLKRELKCIARVKCGLNLWVVAQAYVYFEKLVLKAMISKHNRKLCAGACLILSAKLSDIKGADLTKLIQQIEDDFRLHRKELLMFEFACLVALEFSLHISDTEIYPHYQRLLYQS